MTTQPTLRRTAYFVTLLVGYAIFAVFTGHTTKFTSYRVWADVAAPAYACSAVVVLLAMLGRGSRQALVNTGLAIAALGTTVLPLIFTIRRGAAMPELRVISNAGAQFVTHGTPFLNPDQLAGAGQIYAYNPYLPGMAIFGVFAKFIHSDLRLIFLTVFLGCIAASTRMLSGNRTVMRSIAQNLGWLVACPVIAIPLVAGGDDLPVLGLICLGLVLATTQTSRNGIGSGLAVGLACSLKAIAIPAFPVVLALVAYRQGRRASIRYLVTGASTFFILVAPSFIRSPQAFIENAVKFPLGLAAVATTASDPLPGHLIASQLPGGKLIALVLLTIAGVGVGASLFLKQPRDVHECAQRIALGLTLAFLLAPAVRWGYFVYPVGILLWSATTSRRDAIEPFVVEASISNERAVAA